MFHPCGTVRGFTWHRAVDPQAADAAFPTLVHRVGKETGDVQSLVSREGAPPRVSRGAGSGPGCGGLTRSEESEWERHAASRLSPGSRPPWAREVRYAALGEPGTEDLLC